MGLPRRNLIRGLLGITGTTLFPSNAYLDLETLERLSRALQSSSDLDERTVTRLEMVTKSHRYEYRGICLLRLHRSEPAQDILHEQLVRVEKRALLHQQSIASVDLAVSFVQQASIRYVYEYAINALRFIEETRSGRVFQRIQTLRQSLNPWINTTYVKNLDEYIHSIASDLMKGVQ